MLFYVESLIVYFFANAIFLFGLNVQFGLVGIINLAYIAFFALGAYAASIFALGPATGILSKQFAQNYFFGAKIPWPVPIIIAIVAVVAFSLLIGKVLMRNMRADFAALASVAVMQVCYNLVTNVPGIFNGPTGLAGIPEPLHGVTHLGDTGYSYLFMGICAVGCVIAFWVAQRVTKSPLGRTYRAIRENTAAASALGKNVQRHRLVAFAVGGAFAGLAGALFVEYTSVWAPSAWGFPETVLLFAALYIGGRGNNWGMLLGSLIVYVGLSDGLRLLPPMTGSAVISASLQWIYIGALLVFFIWFRPQGLIPERTSRWPVVAQWLEGKNVSAVATFANSRTLSSRLVSAFSGSRRDATAQDGAVSPPVTSLRASDGGTRFEVGASQGFAPGNGSSVPENGATPGGGDHALELECRDVVKTFGGIRAVDHCSLTITGARITGLIGPNGAGKSTLLEVVSGFQRPNSGDVLWQGERISGMPPFEIARRGIVRTFQKSSEFPRLSVLENMMVAPQGQLAEALPNLFFRPHQWRAQDAELLDRAHELLVEFGLMRLANEYAGNLSGGQLRLLELARALMARPRLLLLDEPMAGVNPALRDELLDHLVQLVADGLAIVIVEHEMEVIDRICDNVFVMVNGALLAEGHMSSLREDARVVEAYLS